jgi:hypothetical protein
MKWGWGGDVSSKEITLPRKWRMGAPSTHTPAFKPPTDTRRFPAHDNPFNTPAQAGEDAELSRPIKIDLSAMFDRKVKRLTELSLTAARRRADMPPRAQWHTEPLAAAGHAGAGPPPAGAPGGAQRRRSAWGDAAAGLCGGGGGGRGDEGQAFDVWSHPGDAPPVFELYPMEIRTWELLLE